MWCSCFKPSVLDIAIAQHIAKGGRDERISAEYSSRMNSIELEQTSRLIKLLRQTTTKFSRSHSAAPTSLSITNQELTPAILKILLPLIANPELSPIIVPELLPLISTFTELVPLILPTLIPLIKINPELAPLILQTLIPLIYTLPELAPFILPILRPIIPLIETNQELATEYLQILIPLIILHFDSSTTRKSLIFKQNGTECEYL